MTEEIRNELYGLCKAACAEHDDIDEATLAVQESLCDDAPLRERLRDQMEWHSIRETIYDVRAADRTAVKGGATEAMNTKRGPDVMARVHGTSILDMWTMPDGRVLGDWTGTEVMERASVERGLSRGHAANAAYYERLGELAKDRKIREKVAPKRARVLWENARETVGEAG